MIRTIAQHKDFVKFVNADHGGHLRGDQWRGGAAAIRLAFADRCTGAMGGDAWQCDSHGDACRRRGRADGHDRSGWPRDLHNRWDLRGRAEPGLFGQHTEARPAKAAEAILPFGTGLAAVSPAVATGVAAPVDPLSWVTAPVTAPVGDLPASVIFSGLAPGFAGLWQVNVVVPPDLSAAQQVTVSVRGVTSNTVEIWVAP